MNALARQKITQARAHLVMSNRFYGHLLLSKLGLIETAAVSTMGVDGRNISYNPDWVLTLRLDELKFVLAHECEHCTHLHHSRQGSRESERWNQACDYVINPNLIRANIGTMPKGGLNRPDLDGLSAEQAYERLTAEQGAGGGKQPQAGAGQPGNDPGQPTPDCGGCGWVSPLPDKSEAATAKDAQDWHIATIQAAEIAKAMGQLPAHLKRLVESICEPKADWRQLLRQFADSCAKNEHSWLRPNRRFAWQGITLPSRHSNELGEVAILVDTSGSIGGATLEAFASEINAVFSEVKPSHVHVVYFDSEVAGHDEFEGGDEFEINARGGGGTSIRSAFDYLDDKGISPACAVCFTDLCNSDWPVTPSYPVLFAAHDAGESPSAPFGEIIVID